MMRKLYAGALLAGCLLCGGGLAAAQAVTAVPQLDLKKMVGTWYEVDHSPGKAERKCVQAATVLYALGDKPGRFSVVQSCELKDSFRNVTNLDGRRAEANGVDGRLKTHRFLVFYKKYDVVALAPDYRWAVLETPDRKWVSILSRGVALSDTDASEVRSRLASTGYDPAKLVVPPKATGTLQTSK